MICILNRRQSISLLYNSKWLDLVLAVTQWLHILSTIASGQLRSTLDNWQTWAIWEKTNRIWVGILHKLVVSTNENVAFYKNLE